MNEIKQHLQQTIFKLMAQLETELENNTGNYEATCKQIEDFQLILHGL